MSSPERIPIRRIDDRVEFIDKQVGPFILKVGYAIIGGVRRCFLIFRRLNDAIRVSVAKQHYKLGKFPILGATAVLALAPNAYGRFTPMTLIGPREAYAWLQTIDIGPTSIHTQATKDAVRSLIRDLPTLFDEDGAMPVSASGARSDSSGPKNFEVPLLGDAVEAIEHEGYEYVAINRICDNLGVDPSSQHTKLRNAAWATMVIITMVAQDGRKREVATIPLDQLPMWLATMTTGKIAPHLRPKIEQYQKLAAKVLADFFLGRKTPQLAAPANQPVLVPYSAPAVLARDDNKYDKIAESILATNEMVNQIGQLVKAGFGVLTSRIDEVAARVDSIESRTQGQPNQTVYMKLKDYIIHNRLEPNGGGKFDTEACKTLGYQLTCHCRRTNAPIQKLPDEEWAGGVNGYLVKVMDDWRDGKITLASTGPAATPRKRGV